MGANLSEVSHEGSLAAREAHAALDDLSGVAEVIEAGMRARGVAEACDSLDLPAVLMDAAGRVLHVGPKAAALFGGLLRIEADHLVGGDQHGNAAIEAALNGVLGSGASADDAASPIVSVGPDGGLAIAAVAYGDASPLQILRAIVFLGPDEATLRARMAVLDL